MEIFKIQIFLTYEFNKKKKKKLALSEVHRLTFSIILHFLFYFNFCGLFGLNMATQIPAKQEANLGVIHETCTSI